MLSTKSQKHLQILLGSILAFIIVDGLAIGLGSYISAVIPAMYLKILSAIVFIVFGLIILIKRDKEKYEHEKSKNLFIAAFLLVFISELGDKTQIAAALFAAEYNPLIVFMGTILALSFLSIITVYFGKRLSDRIDRRKIDLASGILFIILGCIFLFF